MTIAACYVCPEGVVFGADTAGTVAIEVPDGNTIERQYLYQQKIFPVGDPTTLGLVTWGMGNLDEKSVRSLARLFANELKSPPGNMAQVGERLSRFFWGEYERSKTVQKLRAEVADLLARERTTQEDAKLKSKITQGTLGMVLGGYVEHERVPQAFEIVLKPDLPGPPPAMAVEAGIVDAWGMVRVAERLELGIDPDLFEAVLASGNWQGSRLDLRALAAPFKFRHPAVLPLRDAIDWIHWTILLTIQTGKFYHEENNCGGSSEVAVIPSDGPFQWVRHRGWGSAIVRGDCDE